jgi:hypothetical protein
LDAEYFFLVVSSVWFRTFSVCLQLLCFTSQSSTLGRIRIEYGQQKNIFWCLL